MIQNIWIGACVLFLAGWAIVFASPGSQVGEIAVYAGTGALLLAGLVIAVGWAAARLRRG